jgi:hypothetical protein
VLLAPKAVGDADGARARDLIASSAPLLDGALSTGLASAPTRERADVGLTREGRSWCAGGTLVVLPDFVSEDGQLDLVVHFHGATDLVQQSFSAVKLEAVLVVFNLGVSSGAYEGRFGYGPVFHELLDQVKSVMSKRHLREPKIRRIALSAFSAGFAAVERVLDQPDETASIDAVLLLDGIHTSYDVHRKMDLRPLEPFMRFARAAVKRDKLFYITHSDIPTYDYASTHETTDAILRALDVQREPGGERPPLPDLPALGSAYARSKLQTLEPRSHADEGDFHVHGYAGNRAENHVSHLHQMATTALPLLAERWRPAEPRRQSTLGRGVMSSSS